MVGAAADVPFHEAIEAQHHVVGGLVLGQILARLDHLSQLLDQNVQAQQRDRHGGSAMPAPHDACRTIAEFVDKLPATCKTAAAPELADDATTASNLARFILNQQ